VLAAAFRPLDRADLVRKYGALLTLRQQHASGPPRAVLRELCREFPGALREYDALSELQLQRRLAELTDAARPLPEWAIWFAAYHEQMRRALAIKAELRQVAPDERGEHLARALAQIDAGGELGRSYFEIVAKPPLGRLNTWVFVELARRFGVSAALLERTLFPRAALGSMLADSEQDHHR